MEQKSQDLSHVYVAGAFGNYLDSDNALAIGLLPPVPKERIEFVGNAAGIGAQIALIDVSERERVAELRRGIEFLELATDAAFHEVFVRELTFGSHDRQRGGQPPRVGPRATCSPGPRGRRLHGLHRARLVNQGHEVTKTWRHRRKWSSQEPRSDQLGSCRPSGTTRPASGYSKLPIWVIPPRARCGSVTVVAGP